MGSSYNLKRSLAGAAALALILNATGWTASAQSSETGRSETLAIAAGPLGDVLSEISLRTGVPVIFAEELVAGRRAPAVSGTYSAETAVRLVLAGTALEVRAGQSGALRVVAAPSHSQPLADAPVRRPAQSEAIREEADLRIDRVTVTGTSLRGIAPDSSPLQVYSREDILGSGVTTTEQFVRTLPQNFGGGSTEFLPGGLPNDDNSSRNDSYGSGVNIRGLGSGATLTLLNGRRVAPSSTIGGFADVSLFPITAIERIDVLTDGASSIYGADAVGGVVNFILREDFDGAETSLRYGSVTSGDMDEVRLSQTLGRTWASGNALATYEFSQRDNLSLSDRPGITAPVLFSGAALPDSYEFDLLPQQERHSVLMSLGQDVGPDLRVSGTGMYALREAEGNSYSATNSGNWTFNQPTTESMSFNLGADYQISQRLSVTADAGYSQVRTHTRAERRAPTVQTVTPRVSLSKLWSAGLQANAELLDLPGGTVRLALGGQVRQEDFVNRAVWTGTASRDGSREVSALYGEVLIPVVGEANQRTGVRRLELNLSGRVEEYSDFGSTSNPKLGLLWSPVTGLNLRTTYSTSYAPPPLGRTGAMDQAAQAAPYAWLRNIYGIDLPDPSLDGVNYLTANGTGRDLGPETSDAFTAGFDWRRTDGPGDFETRLTYYHTDFRGRLGTTPVPGNVNAAFAPGLAFSDPDLFPPGTIVFNPTPDQVQDFLDDYAAYVLFYSGGLTEVDNIGFLSLVNVVRNLARTETSGFDLAVSYARPVADGTLSMGLNANYILEFTQQAGPATPVVETVNTLYSPVDLKLRASLGYSSDNWSVSSFVNHVDSYDTDLTASARPVGSWTTVDLSASYSPGGRRQSWLTGTTLGLSVLNLFDQAPPRAPAAGQFRITGYDPANASPLGRYVALEIRRTF